MGKRGSHSQTALQVPPESQSPDDELLALAMECDGQGSQWESQMFGPEDRFTTFGASCIRPRTLDNFACLGGVNSRAFLEPNGCPWLAKAPERAQVASQRARQLDHELSQMGGGEKGGERAASRPRRRRHSRTKTPGARTGNALPPFKHCDPDGNSGLIRTTQPSNKFPTANTTKYTHEGCLRFTNAQPPDNRGCVKL